MDLFDGIETDKKTEKEIANTVVGVSNSIGEEILVPAAKGRGIDAIYDKMNPRSLAGMMTFKYLKNTGVFDVRDSSLFRKIKEESKLKKFIDTVNDINTMMDKVGKNEAYKVKVEMNDMDNEAAKSTKLVNLGKGTADMGSISAEPSVSPDKTVHMNEVRSGEDEENSEIDFSASVDEKETVNRLMFLKELPASLRKYIVGYEVYGDSKAGNNGPTDYRVWKKWDDTQILKLIRKGAYVTWYGPNAGPFEAQTIGLSNGSRGKKPDPKPTQKGAIVDLDPEKHRKNFLKIKKYIKENKFSFHQVKVDEVIPVINDLRYIAEHFGEYLKEEEKKEEEEREQEKKGQPMEEKGNPVGMNLIEGQKIRKIEGKQKAQKKEVEFDFRKLFPINSRGLFVNSDILHDDNYISIYNIGPGLHDARVEGGRKEGYLGVPRIDTIINDVIGNDNFVYITGTLTKIYIPQEITIEGKSEFDEGTVYSPGEVHIMRGIYIDKEGNFKIGQIATKVNVGGENNVSTRELTATQLLKRKLITSAFRILKSEPNKDIDSYNIAAQQSGFTQGTEIQLRLMKGKSLDEIAIEDMNARIPRLEHMRKRKYGDEIDFLERQETGLIEDRPRKTRVEEKEDEEIQRVMSKPTIEGED